MPDIHSTAWVDPSARLGDGVTIGPFSIVEGGVEIGAGTRVGSYSVIKTGTRVGRENVIAEHVVLGGLPQHKTPPPRVGLLEIGDRNVIREQVTIHRALKPEGLTRLGNDCLLMVAAHVAHDCLVGDHVILANNVMLAGHVTVGDRAFLSGAAAAHQFCRIGTLAMVGGQAHLTKDVPPFVTIDGLSSMVVGLNLIGLRRAGVDAQQVQQLKHAYRLAYRSGLRWDEILDALRTQFPSGLPALFHSFLAGTQRGCVQERRTPRRAILKLHVAHESNESNESNESSDTGEASPTASHTPSGTQRRVA